MPAKEEPVEEPIDHGPALQRAVFKWISLAEANKGPVQHQTITAYEVATKHGVPKEKFWSHMNEELEEAESCQSLPFTLLLVVSYACMIIAHDNAQVIMSVEDSIDFDIQENANFAFSSDYIGHKGVHDVNSHADFWSWVTIGFFPLVFQHSRGFSEGLNMSHPLVMAAEEEWPRADRGMLLNYNRIVGGIRMRQERSELYTSCPSTGQNELLLEFYGKQCVQGLKYERDPEKFEAKETTEKNEREVWFYTHDDMNVTMDRLANMETAVWLDGKTMKVEIAIPIYNANYGVHSITFVNFFFSRGGHIFKHVITQSTYANWYVNYIPLIYDVIFACCMLYILFTELAEIVQVIKLEGFGAFFTSYIGFWNTVDWVSVFAGVVLIILFYVLLQQTKTLNLKLESLGKLDEATQQKRYRAWVHEHLSNLIDTANFAHVFKLGLSCYPLVIVMRLFKAFAAQPRLAVVTSTLSICMVDMLHFLLVFLSVFMTYAVAGVLLFGREVDDFTTYPRAINACFRHMMGDFDWDELRVVGRPDAGVWFWTFQVVVTLLMMNMLMAIIMDAYSEVKAKAVDAETLWDEVKQSWKRFQGHRTGVLVPLPEVKKALQNDQGQLRRVKSGIQDQEEDDIEAHHQDHRKKQKKKDEEFTLVTVDFLRRFIPTIRVEQAVDLIQSAVFSYYQENAMEADIEELLITVRKINERTKKLKRRVKARMSGQDEEDSAGRGFAVQMAWVRSELADAELRIGYNPNLKQIQEMEPEEEDEEQKEIHDRIKSRRRQRTVILPFESLEEVEEGTMALILDDADQVIQACRDSGIGAENDVLRRSTVGAPVQLLEKDAHDQTIKCRVPGVGDLWYGVSALGLPEADMDGLGQGLDLTTFEQHNLKGSSLLQERVQIKARIDNLEKEKHRGHKTVSEALMALSELEWQLHQQNENRRQAGGRFDMLKRKVLVLEKENQKLRQAFGSREEQVEAIMRTRDKYFDHVREMVDKNQQIKGEISVAEIMATNEDGRYQAAEAQLRYQQHTLEQQLEEALEDRNRVEEASVRAYQGLAHRVEEIASALELAGSTSAHDNVTKDLARELLALRDGARMMLGTKVEPETQTLRANGNGNGYPSPRANGSGMGSFRTNGSPQVNGSNGFGPGSPQSQEFQLSLPPRR